MMLFWGRDFEQYHRHIKEDTGIVINDTETLHLALRLSAEKAISSLQ
jgi:hypothetical protein